MFLAERLSTSLRSVSILSSIMMQYKIYNLIAKVKNKLEIENREKEFL
jgi:hypothetical protein